MIYSSELREVLKEEVLQISLDASLSLLQLTWRQHPTSEQYRQGYQQAIRVALKCKAKYWLTDSRQVHYLHLADQYWMYDQMHPLLTSSQLLRFALVLQPETFLMTDRKPVLDNIKLDKESRDLRNLEFFLNLEGAKAWLLE